MTSAVENSPSDAEIEKTLASAPAALWRGLWETAEKLGGGTATSTWVWPEPKDAADKTPTQLPFVVYAEPVDQMVRLFYELGVVVKGFDWIAWNSRDRYPRGVGLSEAPVAEAARLATAYVRGDRFSEGALASGIADGTIRAILLRLRTWWDTRQTSGPLPRP